MRIHYRTLYVPTVDLRTSKMKQRNTNCIPIDEMTHTIHSVYIHNCKAELSSTVSSVYTQIQCSVSGTSKTKFFVADINIKCNGVHCMRAAGENFLEVHCVCIFTSSYQNHMEPYVICICSVFVKPQCVIIFIV